MKKLKKLGREFYDRDSTIVAKELLGKLLVHKVNGQKISARIVETEAYMGVNDKAAHSYGGKRTPRVEVMYGGPGYSYVFTIYGIHCCFNTVTREEGNPQAVLIRAAEPVEGIEWMAQKRYGKPYEQLTKSQKRGLTNGPGKLCAALGIDSLANGVDLCGDEIYVEDDAEQDIRIVSTKRVGIDYAEEAKDYPWRFYVEGNEYVSIK
ncbi:DNA-3-methyladenine glycosylase [Desulfitobacterium dehalogenans ATCC 51507]|uniref:Putative 3-methyladenine DNA glycosylase n=1 Tax=Desulfitobacterium dehalogenans (strain ATCC 51507 / DSM 9161 / JW/IU-DC1) TaxID=756499 RepID=I4A836_DESDJ|nr:DNA-3-methyladenine glycosylase [Desulfitobacterium dehalogenans]AFM00121.1 DNA-3-methyladenine glycosylase [Desulfitobacterium dehalogenans ATCC 51507]